MSKVKMEDITYPYINIRLTDEDMAARVGVNLSSLYLYIDSHVNLGRLFEYGNAYKAIKEKAKELTGRGDVKISKRQVASLRKYFTILGTNKYIKIPYRLYYIFKAIFEIVDVLRITYPLPTDLEVFVGQMRREIFYSEQSELFDEWYRQNRNELTRGLHDDIFAGNSVLSENF